MRPIDVPRHAGFSVFVSTLFDLVRFAMGIDSGKLLAATVQLLQTSQRLPRARETGYGLGWDLETRRRRRADEPPSVTTGSCWAGTVTSFMTFPEHRLVVAVTSNTSYADTYAVAVKVAQAFAERRKEPAGK